MHRKSLAVIAAGVLVLLAASRASALPIITVDEYGVGFLDFGGGPISMPGVLAPDPGPGGLRSVLTYDLLGPPSIVAGDILLQDGVGGPILDVIRFNPAGTGGPGYHASLLFYSDNIDGFDSLGDTPGPPGLLYANRLTLLEIGMEGGLDGAIYTPLVGQPGYVPGFQVTYNLISDGHNPIPEPSTMLLLGTGVIAVVGRFRKSRATK